MKDHTIYVVAEGKRLAFLWRNSYANFKQVEWLDLNPLAEESADLVEYMKELESLDSSILNVPIKILKRYLHHFNPIHIVNFAI